MPIRRAGMGLIVRENPHQFKGVGGHGVIRPVRASHCNVYDQVNRRL